MEALQATLPDRDKFSIPLLLVSLISICLSCTTSNRFLRLSLFSTVALSNITNSFRSTGSPTKDYALGVVLAHTLLLASNYLILDDPHRDYRLKRNKETSIADEPSFFKRLYMGSRLLLSVHGVGWTHEPPSLRQTRPRDPTTPFILRQLSFIAKQLLVWDLASVYMRANPAGSSWLVCILNAWAFGCIPKAKSGIQHTLLSLVSVGTGWSSEEDWVDHFGHWGDAYTVRRFWGRTWHQLFRVPFSAHGRWLARRLGCKPGSAASSYTQLYTAFFLSGLIHVSADHLMHANWDGAYEQMAFFLLQAVAITFEDYVISLAGGSLDKKKMRYVGYAWTLLWFGATFHLLVDHPNQLGFTTDGWVIPRSPILGLLFGDWKGEMVNQRLHEIDFGEAVQSAMNVTNSSTFVWLARNVQVLS